MFTVHFIMIVSNFMCYYNKNDTERVREFYINIISCLLLLFFSVLLYLLFCVFTFHKINWTDCVPAWSEVFALSTTAENAFCFFVGLIKSNEASGIEFCYICYLFISSNRNASQLSQKHQTMQHIFNVIISRYNFRYFFLWNIIIIIINR